MLLSLHILSLRIDRTAARPCVPCHPWRDAGPLCCGQGRAHVTAVRVTHVSYLSGYSKGGWYAWKPSSSSDLSIRAFRAYPLIEIGHSYYYYHHHNNNNNNDINDNNNNNSNNSNSNNNTVPCRAIRGDRILVNSILPSKDAVPLRMLIIFDIIITSITIITIIIINIIIIIRIIDIIIIIIITFRCP